MQLSGLHDVAAAKALCRSGGCASEMLAGAALGMNALQPMDDIGDLHYIAAEWRPT
jgi:hypothetical protein